MRRLFLNQHLKDRTGHPKVAVLKQGRLVYGNAVDVLHQGEVVATLRTGTFTSPAGHRVVAWVETKCDVRIR